jgi:hypothetical protein
MNLFFCLSTKIWNFSRYFKIVLTPFVAEHWETPQTMAVQTATEYHIINNTILNDPWRYHPCIDIHTSNQHTGKGRTLSPNKGQRETQAITLHLRCAIRCQLVHVTTSTSVFIISNGVTMLCVRVSGACH